MLNDATLIIPFHFSVTVIMTQPVSRGFKKEARRKKLKQKNEAEK